MDYDKLEAGRELDALVAKKVMEWCQEYAYDLDGNMEPMWKEPEYLVPPNSDEAKKTPRFSTDIAAAWKVIITLYSKRWFADIDNLEVDGKLMWGCLLWTGDGRAADSVYSDADTAPLAICRAALKAVAASSGGGRAGE